jgi:hypothetical protein
VLRPETTIEPDGVEKVSDKLSHAGFAEQLNSKFCLRLEDLEIELELSEVSELKVTPGQEVFSLVFRGPATFVLSQQSYRLEHDQMSAFDLLIVPIRRDDKGVYYEAVFNRLVEAKTGVSAS